MKRSLWLNAAIAFTKSIQHNMEGDRVHIYRANCLEKLGRPNEALESYKKAVKIEKDSKMPVDPKIEKKIKALEKSKKETMKERRDSTGQIEDEEEFQTLMMDIEKIEGATNDYNILVNKINDSLSTYFEDPRSTSTRKYMFKDLPNPKEILIKYSESKINTFLISYSLVKNELLEYILVLNILCNKGNGVFEEIKLEYENNLFICREKETSYYVFADVINTNLGIFRILATPKGLINNIIENKVDTKDAEMEFLDSILSENPIQFAQKTKDITEKDVKKSEYDNLPKEKPNEYDNLPKKDEPKPRPSEYDNFQAPQPKKVPNKEYDNFQAPTPIPKKDPKKEYENFVPNKAVDKSNYDNVPLPQQKLDQQQNTSGEGYTNELSDYQNKDNRNQPPPKPKLNHASSRNLTQEVNYHNLEDMNNKSNYYNNKEQDYQNKNQDANYQNVEEMTNNRKPKPKPSQGNNNYVNVDEMDYQNKNEANYQNVEDMTNNRKPKPKPSGKSFLESNYHNVEKQPVVSTTPYIYQNAPPQDYYNKDLRGQPIISYANNPPPSYNTSNYPPPSSNIPYSNQPNYPTPNAKPSIPTNPYIYGSVENAVISLVDQSIFDLYGACWRAGPRLDYQREVAQAFLAGKRPGDFVVSFAAPNQLRISFVHDKLIHSKLTLGPTDFQVTTMDGKHYSSINDFFTKFKSQRILLNALIVPEHMKR